MVTRLVSLSTISFPLPSFVASLKSGMSESLLALDSGAMIYLLIWSLMSDLPFKPMPRLPGTASAASAVRVAFPLVDSLPSTDSAHARLGVKMYCCPEGHTLSAKCKNHYGPRRAPAQIGAAVLAYNLPTLQKNRKPAKMPVAPMEIPEEVPF
jgi:hypothetical protein